MIAIEKEVVPLRTMMTGRTPLQIMGLAWVGISRLLSNLVIPDTPVDPAAVHNCLNDRLRHEKDNIGAQISLHQQLEGILTGNENNDFIRYLTPQLDQNLEQLAQLPVLPSRNDVSRLHLFWSEVLQFQSNVLPPSKLDPLVAALLQGDVQALLREQVTQDSLQGFYQRLDSVYPEFVDISALLKLSVLYMRLGLRTVLESTSAHLSANPSAELVTTLVSFPSVAGSDSLISNLQIVGPSGTGAFRHVLLALGALSSESSIDLRDEEHIKSLHVAYEQAIGLWLIDRAKEKKETEDASTLYRTVNYDAVTEVEIEEEEFLAMFPTFEDALETDIAPARSQTAPSSSLLVQPEDMSTLLRIHYILTGLGHAETHGIIYAEMKSKVVQEIVIECPECLPETLDSVGIPFQLNILHSRILSLDTKQNPAVPTYNFYNDSNYTELKKGASIIDALKRRLVGISQEWPDQMVVQHLIERCNTILGMSSKTSIAKAISMLEQLLVQSEDWEMYSNRHNSIKLHQEEIVRLMVDWRRLELACWQTLLDSQAKTFTVDLAQWWFRLYDAVIRGPLNVLDEASNEDGQDLNRYLVTLIPLLDDFVTSSPLGQFEPRMQLIQSFERYIILIAPSKSGHQRSALDRVARILNASYRYYYLFADPLRKRLMDEKAVLEQEVKNFIRLASWKDVNVQALKQSAQRTHRQLYKIMRKFRDILRQPIAAQLQPFLAGDVETQALSLDRISPSNPIISFPQSSLGMLVNETQTSIGPIGPAHLLNLQKTFDRYQALVNKRLRPFISIQSARSVDEIAVEIITTAKSLASLILPSDEPHDRREKHRKALLVRKRKAWADMLKELKRAGLASNLKPEVLRQNADQQWIREQPMLPMNQQMNIELQRGDSYFVKLCGCLPSLRSLLSTHHADLTTRELQRGYMFLESGFAMGIDLRAR